MATFASLNAANTRLQSQLSAGTWITGFVGLDKDGTPMCRFLRPMSATGLDAENMTKGGGWNQTTADNVD